MDTKKNGCLKKSFSELYDCNSEKQSSNTYKKNKLSNKPDENAESDTDLNNKPNTNSNTNLEQEPIPTNNNSVKNSFIIIRPLISYGFNNNNKSNFLNQQSYGGDGNGNDDGNGDDDDEDEDEYEDYDEEDDEDYDEDKDECEYKEEKNKDKKNDNKINISYSVLKTEDIKYFDSSDSSDSENEFDYSNPKNFSSNLLKKIQRHNSTAKPDEVATKFNSKVKSMDKKYKQYSKNPSKYRNLRQFYKNLSECKNLYNLLMDDIEYYTNKFNFNKFIKKYEKNIKNKEEHTGTKEPNLLDILFGTSNNSLSLSNSPGSKLDNEFKELYDKDNKSHQSGLKYFKTLDKKQKLDYINKLKKINNQMDLEDKRPNYMKVLDMEIEESNKCLILQRIQQMEGKPFGDSKLKNWINKIMGIPFGIYVKPPVCKTDYTEKIRNYLGGVRKLLDSEVYGHQATKDQLVKILAHTITNPQEGGNVFALQGPPGIGKTALIQDGISKALGRPFAFISLGGATDASFLEGHDFTYEGSQHGRIIEILQQAKCMNPVIYFDELDKVSETAKGEEIINILMHLTDSTQNSHFNDKYFGGINFDLSKAIIIFSFNEEHKISRILRDRMKIIRVKGYKMLDKINIARDYLIPKLIKQIGLDDIILNIGDKLLEYMIDTYTNEGGVRKLKELLNDVFLEINLRKLEGNNDWVSINNYTSHKNKNKKRGITTRIPNEITLTQEIIEKDFLKKKHKITHLKINQEPMIGIVNGLWANDLGMGGLIPIECCWIPSGEKLSLNLTGMQGDVMKESMSVARSVAWRILPEYIKLKLGEKWKECVDTGIHIHCPDGATPKDGPSAGGAITTCLISLLTGSKVSNEIAMTGEINLKGRITAIGGLEEKIFGAKKAGAKLVLCPKENQKDLDEIVEKFPTLFDGNFQAKTIENIWEVLSEVIQEPIDLIRFD